MLGLRRASEIMFDLRANSWARAVPGAVTKSVRAKAMVLRIFVRLFTFILLIGAVQLCKVIVTYDVLFCYNLTGQRSPRA